MASRPWSERREARRGAHPPDTGASSTLMSAIRSSPSRSSTARSASTAIASGTRRTALAAAPRYGRAPRGVARAVSELPGRFALDVAEMTALARGSIRYRTLLL